MYRREGREIHGREEGAAFYEPERIDDGMVPPRPMGLQRGMLTRGFVPVRGIGDDGVSVETNLTVPFLAAAAGAIGAFFLFRRR